MTATLDGLTIQDANNTANGLGGGMSIQNANNITLSNMVFFHDSALARGGAIFGSGIDSLNISNSVFINNSSPRGGAVRVEGSNNIHIVGSDFNGNSALIGGGVYFFENTNSVVDSSSFENNNASSNGGGIRSQGDQSLSVTHSTFFNNFGGTFAGGGILSRFSTHVVLDSNQFIHNTTNGEFVTGSGAQLEFGDNFVVTNNRFDSNAAIDNVSHISGAAGLVVAFVQNALVKNNTFTNNVADLAAAFATQGIDTISIENNLFKNNYANVAGAALGLGNYSPGFLIPDLVPDNNVCIKDNIFIDNTAGQAGGVIFSGQETNLVIDQNVFTHNSASQGGAIADASSTSLRITNNVINPSNTTGIWLDGLQQTVNMTPITNASQVIGALVRDNNTLWDDNILIL